MQLPELTRDTRLMLLRMAVRETARDLGVPIDARGQRHFDARVDLYFEALCHHEQIRVAPIDAVRAYVVARVAARFTFMSLRKNENLRRVSRREGH